MSRGPSFFQRAKTRQGYVPAQQRHRCGNCTHGVEQFAKASDASAWSCKLGGFFVTVNAFCNEHETFKPTPVPEVAPVVGVAA